jgi:hypothetical protein
MNSVSKASGAYTKIAADMENLAITAAFSWPLFVICLILEDLDTVDKTQFYAVGGNIRQSDGVVIGRGLTDIGQRETGILREVGNPLQGCLIIQASTLNPTLELDSVTQSQHED